MEDVWKSNLAAVQRLYPHYVAPLQPYDSKQPNQACIATSGYPLKQIEGFRLLLFLGLGDGHFLHKVLSLLQGQKVQVLIVERSWEMVAQNFARFDFSRFLEGKQVAWLLGEDIQGIGKFLHDYCAKEEIVMAAAATCRITAHAADEQPFYTQVEEKLRACQTHYENTVMPFEDAYHALFNIARNIPMISTIPFFDALKGSCTGKTGVVVSAGPSLTRSIPLLKKHQDRAVIFCVDAVAKLLLAEGITPHFVASLERVPESVHFFTGMPQAANSWLVASPILVPEALQAYQGPKCFLLRNSALLDWFLPEEQTHSVGASSAHLAYWGLHLLGCNPIILLGQDLAFAPDSSQSHAAGVAGVGPELVSATYRAWQDSGASGDTEWVEGNNGRPIRSWFYFIRFLKDFDRMIHESGKRCINAIPQEYGAKIEHTERMDPEEAFVRFATTPFQSDGIKQRLTSSHNPQKTKRQLQKQGARGRDYLENQIIPELLDILKTISHFYLYHLPDSNRPRLQEEYRQFFSSIEQRDKQLITIDPEAHQKLLYLFVVHHKLKTSFNIAQIHLTDQPFPKKILPLVEQLQGYYQNLVAWSMRITALLRDGERNES